VLLPTLIVEYFYQKNWQFKAVVCYWSLGILETALIYLSSLSLLEIYGAISSEHII